MDPLTRRKAIESIGIRMDDFRSVYGALCRAERAGLVITNALPSLLGALEALHDAIMELEP